MSKLDDLKGILHDLADHVIGADHLHERIDNLSSDPEPAPAAAPVPDEREAEKAALRARLAELEGASAETAATG